MNTLDIELMKNAQKQRVSITPDGTRQEQTRHGTGAQKLSRKFATNSSRPCRGRLLVVVRGSEPCPLRGSGYQPGDARGHEAVRRVSRKKHLAQHGHELHRATMVRANSGSHIARLYLKNTFSAHQVQQLVEKSEAAGCSHKVADIASAGKRGSIPKNTSRDLMRKLLKLVTAPPVYWADVPLHDPKGSTTTCRLPVATALFRKRTKRMDTLTCADYLERTHIFRCEWLAHQVLRVLCWSFKQMTEGKFPLTRHDQQGVGAERHVATGEGWNELGRKRRRDAGPRRLVLA